MLLNNFFTILKHACTQGEMKALISIQQHHKIFSGHFPGFPVVPGVCMMQMVKEIIELGQSRKYNLTTAGNIKFLTFINPSEHNQIDVLVNYSENEVGSMSVNASIFSGSITFFKLNATLQPSE